MSHLPPSLTAQKLGQLIQMKQMPSPPLRKGSKYQAHTNDSHNGNQHRPLELLGTRENDCRGIWKTFETFLPGGLNRERPADFSFQTLKTRSVLSYPVCLKKAKIHLLNNNLYTQIEASQPHKTEHHAPTSPLAETTGLAAKAQNTAIGGSLSGTPWHSRVEKLKCSHLPLPQMKSATPQAEEDCVSLQVIHGS